jgi:hypothetical protein
VEIYREVDDLPISQIRAVLMDSLIDIALSSEEWQTVASSQDLVQFVAAIVNNSINVEPAIEFNGFCKDLSMKLGLYLSSSSISTTERLVKALEKATVDGNTTSAPNMLVSGNRIAIRIPDYDTTNLGQVDNLGKYLRWITTILGIKNPEVKVLPDPILGKTIQLTSRVERMMDNTIASLTLPPSESGDRVEFKTGFKANLVEMIAAVNLLRRYGGAIQRGSAPQGQKSNQVTLDDLRSSINTRSGLQEQGVIPFTQILVKSVFNELTKPNGKSIPGKWIHSLKQTNSVKSNTAVLYKLGYESKVPAANKLIAVVKTSVDYKPSYLEECKKKKVRPNKRSNDNQSFFVADEKNSPDGISHQEFRLGCFILLPLIDPKSAKSPKDQISVDPVSVRDKKILNFYSRNRDVVDKLNLAYATYAAVGKKKSKATVLGYESVRGDAVNSTANRVWMDATGKEYQKLMDVPEQTRNFLLKFFNRKLAEESLETPDESVPEAQDTPKAGGSPKSVK